MSSVKFWLDSGVNTTHQTLQKPFVEAAFHIASQPSQAASDTSHDITVNFKEFIHQVDPEANGPAYYYYKGSLTTPKCNEVASWVVLENTISEYQWK